MNVPVEVIKNIQRALSSLNNDIFSNQNITVSADIVSSNDGTGFAKVFEHAEFTLRLVKSKVKYYRYVAISMTELFKINS